MNIVQSVETMEKLLGIPPPPPGAPGGATPPPSPGLQRTPPSLPPPPAPRGPLVREEERSGQLIERVATEFNKLQFYVNKSRGLPLVDQIKPVSNAVL